MRQLLDFSRARPAVEKGNPSAEPAVLLKLMRRLPERLDWLWFRQYDLDSELPDHSVLGKARRRWGPDVFGLSAYY